MLLWIALAVGVLIVWFILDVKHLLRWSARVSQLGAEGRWEELDAAYRRELRPWRPIAWLFMRVLAPGGVQAMYALHLNDVGRETEALAMAERGVRLANRAVLPAALAAHVQVLASAGRYDDARAAALKARQTPDLTPGLATTGALAELWCGRIDEALALAQAALKADASDDQGRTIAALAYGLRGDFKEAIGILLYRPSDISKFYTPEDFAAVMADKDGAACLAWGQQEYAQVMRPARLLVAADIYLDMPDVEGARFSLERARGVLGANPIIVHNFERMSALRAALAGEADPAQKHLAKMWEIARRIPAKRSLQFESHMGAGRCLLALHRPDEAAAELKKAAALALHPIERHVLNYWAGDTKALLADGIATWMCAKCRT